MEVMQVYYTILSILVTVSVISYVYLHSEIDIEIMPSFKGATMSDKDEQVVKDTNRETDRMSIKTDMKDNNNNKRMNVLFLISDDLRPELGCYRGIHAPNPFSKFRISTPHLDALARRSLLLTNAYVQFSLCGPSRTSFLTGRRPDTTKVGYMIKPHIVSELQSNV